MGAGDNAPKCDYLATCKYSLSKEQLSKTRIGIIITALSNSTLYIENLEFFRKVLNPKDGSILTPSFGIEEDASLSELSDVKTVYSYFSSSVEYTNLDDLTLLYRGYEKKNDYIVDYGTKDGERKPYEKVRSITAKESNRFNLIQSLCELF
jgi:hypothetical protein